MVPEVSRILSLLRKERGVSQKEAAAELEVSQALLSHYEKGVRECGLAFLIRAADYYDVSCDYLLGRSPERTGTVLTIGDIPEPDTNATDKIYRGNVLAAIHKKLLTNSLHVIFDLLIRVGNEVLIKEVSTFLSLAVYRSFRTIFDSSSKNLSGMFAIPKHLAQAKAMAVMQVSEATANEEAQRIQKESDSLQISTQTLSAEYPAFASSLLNVVKNCEDNLK